MAQSAAEREPLRLDDLELLESEQPPPVQERVGGARADFVANLGRRVQELSGLARAVAESPSSDEHRDDLRRRMHALAAGARLLRFARLADELRRGEERLLEAAERGEVTPDDLAEIRAIFEQVPALAWGEISEGERTPDPSRAGPPSSEKSGVRRTQALIEPPRVSIAAPKMEPEGPPITVLVVGSNDIADMLGEEGAEATNGIEVERTNDVAQAVVLARALAPDVIVLDADRAGARELCEALLADPLTESTPIVVTGAWTRADAAAPFVAMGVAKAMMKPVTPDALRRACLDAAAAYVRGEPARSPLGEVSVDDLGARLAEELRRGLCDAAIAQGRSARVDLGEGSEVLAALWGAVARIRDLVTIRSSGGVRFNASGPEGAMPIAPWIGSSDGQGGERRGARAPADRVAEVSLDEKVIVVADDDPAVTWFLAGVLRAAGATVHEARDGARALEIAFHVTPHLVISDILMPGVDGFALCRALKRDLVLRDVPVILLSWKEDLLQRVRELGVGADGYLRKEASAASILDRVREVLHGRARLAERIAGEGEVRGRLDGITARTLLGMVAAARPDALLHVRDAAHLYEVEIRDGSPVRASRTASDQSFLRGPEVLTALLGVGVGRFIVTPLTGELLAPELEGSLTDQLVPTIADARAAQRLLMGASLMRVERVELSASRMAGYLPATPEAMRAILRTLATGASPRALIASGQAAAWLVEDVLCDAAAHGAILAVRDASGDDLLPAAVDRELQILAGVRLPEAPPPEPVLDLGPVIATSVPGPVELIEPDPIEEVVVTIEERSVEAKTLAPVKEAAPPLMIVRDALHENRVEVAAGPVVTLGSLTPPPVLPTSRPALPKPPPPAIMSTMDESPSRAVRKPSSFAKPNEGAPPAPQPAPPPAKDNRSMWALFAIAGVVFAIGARMSRDREDDKQTTAAKPPAPAITAEANAAPAPEPAPEPSVTATATAAPAPAKDTGPGTNKADPILPQDLPLRADDKVPPGQGMMEVIAGTSDAIAIDGTQVGNGPIIKRALAPRKEPYEIRVKVRDEERVRFALVREGRLTRVRIAPPWSR